MRSMIWARLGVVATMTLAGCESFESTYVGSPSSGTSFTGVPVVVDRPRFIKVVDKTTSYALVKTDTTVSVKTIPATATPAASGRPIAPTDDKTETTTDSTVADTGKRETLTEVSFELVSVPELFTVDIKRPAAGTAKNSIEFDDGKQFPKKYSSDVDDKTIDAVGDLVGKLADAAKKFVTASSRGGGQFESVKIGETVTRIRLYRIQDFLSASGDTSSIKPVFDSLLAK